MTSMSAPIVLGSPYRIISVGGMQPVHLEDFTGPFITFVIDVEGSPVTLRGSGSERDEAPSNFQEKDPQVNTPIRDWRIDRRDGEFTAQALGGAGR